MGLFSFFKRLDTYGQPVALYHSGRERIQSYFGATIRIISFGLLYVFIQFVVVPQFQNEPKYTFNTQIIKPRANPTEQEKVSRMNHVINQNSDFNLTIAIEQATDLQRQDAALIFNGLNVTEYNDEQKSILQEITSLIDIKFLTLQKTEDQSCNILQFDDLYQTDPNTGQSSFVNNSWTQSSCIQENQLSQQNSSNQDAFFQLDQSQLIIPIEQSPIWVSKRQYSLNFKQINLQKDLSGKLHLIDGNLGQDDLNEEEDSETQIQTDQTQENIDSLNSTDSTQIQANELNKTTKPKKKKVEVPAKTTNKTSSQQQQNSTLQQNQSIIITGAPKDLNLQNNPAKPTNTQNESSPQNLADQTPQNPIESESNTTENTSPQPIQIVFPVTNPIVNSESGPYQILALQIMLDQSYWKKVGGRIKNWTSSISESKLAISQREQILSLIASGNITQDPDIALQVAKFKVQNQTFVDLKKQMTNMTLYAQKQQQFIDQSKEQIAYCEGMLKFISDFQKFRVRVVANQNQLQVTEAQITDADKQVKTLDEISDDFEIDASEATVYSSVEFQQQDEIVLLDNVFDMSLGIKELREQVGPNTLVSKFQKEILRDQSQNANNQLKSIYRMNTDENNKVQFKQYPSSGLSIEIEQDMTIINYLRSIQIFNQEDYEVEIYKYQKFFQDYYENLEKQVQFFQKNPKQTPPDGFDINWTIDSEDTSFIEDNTAIIENFLAQMNVQLETGINNVNYVIKTLIFTMNTDQKIFHEKIHYETYRPGIIEWAVVCFVVLLAADKIIFGPIVQTVNESVYLARMINKLYHKRKVSINNQTGVNKVANVIGINPQASTNDIINSSANQREAIQLSWFDVLIFKYVQCNIFRIFKGPRYYTGKLVYEGEQRLKNDADIGNLLQMIRKSNIFTSSMLDKDTYCLMKYQQNKFIDIVDTNQIGPHNRFTDIDSDVNNHPSIEDVRDYVHLPIQNQPEEVKKGSKGGKGKKAAANSAPQGGSTDGLENKIINHLNHGVIIQASGAARSLKQIKDGKIDGYETAE